MTILVIAPGKSIHTSRLIGALLARGHRVVGVCEEKPHIKNQSNFRFVQFSFYGFWSTLLRGIAKRVFRIKSDDNIIIPLARIFLRDIWLQFKPDITYVLWVDARANACIAGGLRPLVLQCWGSDINQHFRQGADPYRRELCALALAEADTVICDSLDIIQKCKVLAGGPPKLEFLHMGVDTEIFAPRSVSIRKFWREKLSISQDAVVLFSARAWTPLYRHHLILEAFSDALKKSNGNMYIIFKRFNSSKFHGSNQYEEKIRKRADELGISGKIRWLDPVPYEQLPDLYAMTDIVVNFPEMDSFGITLMEAASCKKTIITNDLPCYRDTFIEKYARVVPDSDVGRLENAIIETIYQPVSDSLLTAAQREVQAHYSFEKFSRRLNVINERLKQYTAGF